MNEQKHTFYLDILNTLACLMVVFFHCNTIFYDFSNSVSWKISAVERCIVYSAVPIFFMLTGAKLIDYRKRYTTREFAKRRLVRTGIPFLFWNLFYIAFAASNNSSAFDSISSFFSALINSSFQERYWFFIPLFALYATIPVLSHLVNHRKILWYLVAFTFSTAWLLKPILLLCGIEYNSFISFPLGSGYVMYAVFGYLVATGYWKKKHRILLYLATLASEIFVILYTCQSSMSLNETNQFMVSYNFFPCALLAASIFVFFRHLDTSRCGDKICKIAKTLAACNMGVWLTHSLAIMVIVKLTGLDAASYVFRFALPFLLYAVCAFGTWIVKKIPWVKYIV